MTKDQGDRTVFTRDANQPFHLVHRRHPVQHQHPMCTAPANGVGLCASLFAATRVRRASQPLDAELALTTSSKSAGAQ